MRFAPALAFWSTSAEEPVADVAGLAAAGVAVPAEAVAVVCAAVLPLGALLLLLAALGVPMARRAPGGTYAFAPRRTPEYLDVAEKGDLRFSRAFQLHRATETGYLNTHLSSSSNPESSTARPRSSAM